MTYVTEKLEALVLTTTEKTNRLAGEKSPYLLQHQFNPVDWYPWGEEAIAKARAENKPIFLSIGYSTCHWCHVMERESFENEAIADYLNTHFVSIKVDREERPDLDKIYMTAVQALTSQGGWPLSCFLTPDLKPFFGGTYFPPETRYGRVGFLELLHQINQLWRFRQGEVVRSASDILEKLQEYSAQVPSDLVLHPRLLRNAAEQFKQEYDPKFGGFGDAPKFPRPSQPLFLLRYGIRFEDTDAVSMVIHTCERMAKGGICDQIGGGFHRYSVDDHWLVPHFEKMLYDQAQLVNLYLDAWLVSGNKRFASVARSILDYVLRDMTDPAGGFYSAEDADSEGKEGKFYCWTLDELSELLTQEELAAATRHFGITETGNFVDHSDPDPLPNQNILSEVTDPTTAEEKTLIDSVKRKLFEARAERVRPLRDDKVLASWNGMMLGAMARAGVILREPVYLEAAERNLEFLRENLWDEGTLYHRWREGTRDNTQLLDAYANVLAGVLDLYEATLKPDYLSFAIEVAETMVARFYDPENGGFYQSAAGDPTLILRVKEVYDGAELSGNSVATMALLRLAEITGRGNLRNATERTLRLFGRQLHDAPQMAPHLLQALDFFLGEPSRVAVVGDPGRAEHLIQAIHSVYQPNKVVLGNRGDVEEFTRRLPQTPEPAVYICLENSCQPPETDAAKIREMLR